MKRDAAPEERARRTIGCLTLARIGRNEWPQLSGAEIGCRSVALEPAAARWTDEEHEAAEAWAERVYLGEEQMLPMPQHVQALPWVAAGLAPLELKAALAGVSHADQEVLCRTIGPTFGGAWYQSATNEHPALRRLFRRGLVLRKHCGTYRYRAAPVLVDGVLAWAAALREQLERGES